MSEGKSKRNPKIHLLPVGRQGTVEPGTTILEAARQLGIEIESICGGRQTCDKCKVRVVEGEFQKFGITSAASHVSEPGEKELEFLQTAGLKGFRLSCDTRVLDDVVIEIPPESLTRKQVIRKEATDRAIELKPAVKQFYLEVPAGVLGEHAGDWGRLQHTLEAETGIQATRITHSALKKLQPALKEGQQGITIFVRDQAEVIEILPGFQEGLYGVAIDLGTTTIAAFLNDLHTGELLEAGAVMNPQISYGEDLISRISYVSTNPGGLDTLHKAVIKAIDQLIREVAKTAGVAPSRIVELVLVGNTIMTSIFLGVDPTPLGHVPFSISTRDAYEVSARELKLRLHSEARVHVLPAQAGYVGADNVAVLIAEEPYQDDEQTVIVDIGTNAEIVFGNKEKMYSASSPTGPAFEGGQITFGMRAAPGAIERVRVDPETKQARYKVIGEERWSDEWTDDRPPAIQPSGICGSGMIEVVAEMYLSGVIDSTGRLTPNSGAPAVDSGEGKSAYLLADAADAANGQPIYISQQDIRNIQLAKSALYAGVKLLMYEAGINHIDQIKLAGAFGSYIDPKYAMILGLIPDCDLARVKAVGNAAGDGARIALLNVDKRREAGQVSRSTKYIETAVHPEFQKEFVSALDIPHQSDQFPSLAGLLPKREPSADKPARRTRKFKRTQE